ncbi:hypothetical protein ABFS82_12G009300 [Erythranthe guttata]
MSSMGASYALIHVQQKRAKERLMKKVEAENRAKQGTTMAAAATAVESSKTSRNKKVHPLTAAAAAAIARD